MNIPRPVTTNMLTRACSRTLEETKCWLNSGPVSQTVGQYWVDGEYLVFAVTEGAKLICEITRQYCKNAVTSQQTKEVESMAVRCWANVADDGRTSNRHGQLCLWLKGLCYLLLPALSIWYVICFYAFQRVFLLYAVAILSLVLVRETSDAYFI